MNKVNLSKKFIIKLYILYIEFVARTSQITLSSSLSLNDLGDKIIGFWHGDSLSMNLLLRTFKFKNTPTHVIVTKDARGDYIESILNYYQATALRLPDGIALRGFFKDLLATSKQPSSTLCIALDGPLGPYQEPKKLAPKLAYESQKEFWLVKVSYSHKLSLHKRWDHYAIPLPFSHITFTLYSLNKVEQADLKNFHSYKSLIQDILS